MIKTRAFLVTLVTLKFFFMVIRIFALAFLLALKQLRTSFYG